MRRLSILAGLFLLIGQVGAQPPVQGGPDSWGYTWKSNSAPGGPTFQWVDISQTGTQITGLGDDNVVGPIPIGFNFTYYWNTYNQVYVGSNGYIQFGSGTNIASGLNGFDNFPSTKTAYRNTIGALLSDLTFTDINGAPIPQAKAYYQTIGDSFIITFDSVPFWTDETPLHYRGVNTFQIILNRADSSITINYLTSQGPVDGAYQSVNFISRGMQANTGTIGLDFDSTGTNTSFYPPDSTSIKVYYPDSIMMQFLDAEVKWIFNPQRGGIFLVKNSSANDLVFNVRNAGNMDMSSSDSFIVNVKFYNPLFTVLRNQNLKFKGLKAGQDTTVILPGFLASTDTGSHYVRIAVQPTPGFNDLYSGNNILDGEVVVVEINPVDSSMVLGYDNRIFDVATEGFAGLGMGVYIQPPLYPAKLEAIQADIIIFQNPSKQAPFISRIYLNDGPGNTLGTMIDSLHVSATTALANSEPLDTFQNTQTGDIIFFRRATIPLNNPYTLNNPGEGVYISFEHVPISGTVYTNVVMDEQAPFSRRTYEVIAGIWSTYRDAENSDVALRGVFKVDTIITSLQHPLVQQMEEEPIVGYPNPTKDHFHLKFFMPRDGEVFIVLRNVEGKMVKQWNFSNMPAGKQVLLLDLNELPEGIYFYTINMPDRVVTNKVLIRK